MKIAVIGSYNYRVPLEKGKIHAPLLLAWELAQTLAKFGHEVTYFGSCEKNYNEAIKSLKIQNPNFFPFDESLKNSPGTDSVWQQTKLIYQQSYMSKVLQKSDKFDIFYSWAASQIGPLASLCKKPVVVTHHDSTNMERYNLMFRAFESENVFMIPISEYIRKKIRYNNMLGVVHHGIDQTKIPVITPKDYFCWLGRVTPSKGLHIAIKVAVKSGVKLKIAGPMFEKLPDFGDISEYISKIKKLIAENKNIEYLGAISQEESYQLLAGAKGLIFPTDGIESFSMVTAEAIMAGTPVISTNKGPILEIIKPGLNGYLIKDENDIDGFIQAVKKIDQIDRKACRVDAIQRFSLEKMSRGYEEQFKIAVEKWRKNGKN